MVTLGRRRMVSMWRGRRIVRIVGMRRGHHWTRYTCEGKHMRRRSCTTSVKELTMRGHEGGSSDECDVGRGGGACEEVEEENVPDAGATAVQSEAAQMRTLS